MSKKLFFLASSVLLLLVPASPFSLSAVAEPAKAVTEDKTKTDGGITEAIKKAIAADRELSPCAKIVQVQTVKGVVTLTGIVGSERMKLALEGKVKSISGVEKVVNKIEVKAPRSIERK